jgi:hypothetical protein
MPFRVGNSPAPLTLKTLPKRMDGVLFLSSIDAPIVLLAFVCVAFACKEPEDKFQQSNAQCE